MKKKLISDERIRSFTLERFLVAIKPLPYPESFGKTLPMNISLFIYLVYSLSS